MSPWLLQCRQRRPAHFFPPISFSPTRIILKRNDKPLQRSSTPSQNKMETHNTRLPDHNNSGLDRETGGWGGTDLRLRGRNDMLFVQRAGNSPSGPLIFTPESITLASPSTHNASRLPCSQAPPPYRYKIVCLGQQQQKRIGLSFVSGVMIVPDTISCPPGETSTMRNPRHQIKARQTTTPAMLAK